MTAAAKSLYVFAIYLLILGVLLIITPNTLLSMFQIAETTEVWIRIAGVLTFSVGIYYFYMAPQNNTVFMALTAYVRASIIIWFTLFVLMDWVSPQLILFGIVDLLGALWTFMALRKA